MGAKLEELDEDFYGVFLSDDRDVSMGATAWNSMTEGGRKAFTEALDSDAELKAFITANMPS